MGEREQAEAERARARGAAVVFDANVNYYDVWGEYDLPGTRPTTEQQRAAEARAALEIKAHELGPAGDLVLGRLGIAVAR